MFRLLALPSLLLAALLIAEDAASTHSAQPAPNVAAEGTAVSIGQTVQLSDIVLTPLELIEDSRCPSNVQCVTEGRLRIGVKVEGKDWEKVFAINLGSAYGTNGYIVAFTDAQPVPVSTTEFDPADYRFTFELRNLHAPAE